MLFRRPILLGACLCLAACAGGGKPSGVSRAVAPDEGFQAGQLAKGDMDRVAEVHLRDARLSLRLLAEKLYRRNPREWKKSGQPDLEAAMARLFNTPDWRFPELDGKQGVDGLRLAFREDYAGDRVLALVAGLGGMIDAAFNGKEAFFLPDELDAQKLYNSARNVEIAAWKLNSSRDAAGAPLLLANEGGAAGNLSFERELGRLIGNLDLLSAVLAEKNNRSVVRIVQSLVSAVFLPLK